MKLLLTSNGLTSPEVEQAFLDLTSGGTGLKVAIIPTAGDPIEWVPEHEGDEMKFHIARLIPEKKEQSMAWWHSMQESWEKKGHQAVIVDLKDDPAEVKEKLENVDVIDVTGGDANWLLDWAKKAGLGAYLKDLLERGVVYYAASAGNGLLMPDIGLGWWDPEWKLDHVSLGIVDFLVSVHNKEVELPEKIEKTKKRRAFMQSHMPYPWKIYFLQDGQAIKVHGDSIEHIGPGIKESI
mgnify:CR=1 FL=1